VHEVNKCDLSLLWAVDSILMYFGYLLLSLIWVVDSILMHFGYLLLTCYCKNQIVERPLMLMEK